MTTEKKFDAAVNVIKNLPKNGAYQPSDELKLRFYSYYKQATQGPCKISKPAFWQFVKRAKWDAWSSLGEMTKDEAMNNYIEELKGIIETMSYNEDVAAFLDSLDSFYENTSVQDFHAKVETAIEQSNLQADSLFSDSSEDSERTMLYRENEKDESFTNSFETSSEIIYNTNTYLPETEPEEEFTDSLDFASDNFSKEFLKNYIDEITPELQYIKHESKHNYNLSSDINFLQSNGISTKYDKTIFNHDVNENMDHNSTQQNMDFMNQVMITLRQLQNNLDQVVNRIGNIEDKMQYSIKKPINSNNGKNRSIIS